MNRKWRIIAVLLFLAGIFHFVPEWLEDPRELAIGSWKDRANGIQLQVDATQVKGCIADRHGKIPYEWVQTEDEPYRVQITFRDQTYRADITFDSSDTAIADFLVFDQLPEDARRFIREKNQALNRPEKQRRLVFQRQKEDSP